MEETGSFLGGIVGLILALLIIVLAIFWLIFPWMVYAQLKSLIQGLNKLEDLQSTTQHILTKIEDHLKSIVINSSPTAPTTSQSQKAFYYSIDGTQQGPVTASDLKIMRKDEIVTDDTPVLREGDSEWRTYKDFLSLNR